jgi:hypothetical protein
VRRVSSAVVIFRSRLLDVQSRLHGPLHVLMGNPHCAQSVPLDAGELLSATRGYHPHSARWIRRQRRSRPNRASLKIATAVRTSPILEAVHAVWAPGAFERADVSLIRRSDVAVATFAIWANLKHATTLPPGCLLGAEYFDQPYLHRAFLWAGYMRHLESRARKAYVRGQLSR